ncbi:dipeptidase [Amnibacterium kyonggiense]|uniref:Membrane dipeptidase n=1 Tax=Amnibacterium kyonggiense TaxID=595671 RepID=A0A4R7FHL9_9MICO|nr:dipeptidase [Amnibacterium kyonggiense]TDS75764.1 membrane dipeptidase [Amnibacterium kyonggiense]
MTADDIAATVARALELAPVVDGHNDWPWELRLRHGSSVAGLESGFPGHTDFARLRAGRVGAQLWSVFVEDLPPGSEGRNERAVAETLEQIDVVHRLVEAYPQHLVLARSAADVEAARATGRIASLLGAEGGHQIDESPGVLRMLAALGVRYLTLTHNRTTTWADSATDAPHHGGLSDRGRAFVRELNRLGVLVDLSHVAPATMHAALDVATAPVLFSHSSVRALNDHPRNVPDDVLARLGDNGGVVMITFVPQFLSDSYRRWDLAGRQGPAPRVPLALLADHVEHARDVAGVGHIGLGGDFDGVDAMPEGITGVDGYPALLAELAGRGWSAADLAGLAGANVLRVLRETDDAFAGNRPPTELVI